MKLQEIYEFLDQVSPFELQEAWDNSGLIAGKMDREVSQIVVSLDVDEAMIDASQDGTLFVVHHPLIFEGLTQLDFTRYPANLLEKMIRKGQSLIALHTNFDKTHLNKYVFKKVLGFSLDRQTDFVCVANEPWKTEDLIAYLKEKLGLETVRVVGRKDEVESIALTTGSGGSLIDTVEADCFLTGDIKYHDAMKAVSQGLMMIDIGHYESELFFAEILADELKNLEISVIITPSQNPFAVDAAGK